MKYGLLGHIDDDAVCERTTLWHVTVEKCWRVKSNTIVLWKWMGNTKFVMFGPELALWKDNLMSWNNWEMLKGKILYHCPMDMDGEHIVCCVWPWTGWNYCFDILNYYVNCNFFTSFFPYKGLLLWIWCSLPTSSSNMITFMHPFNSHVTRSFFSQWVMYLTIYNQRKLSNPKI